MKERYISRSIEPALKRSTREFPVVVLVGPRQSGKTTVLKRVFGKTHRYVSMEPPDVRAAAQEDPRGFLSSQPPPVLIDELQYAPDLLFYIKETVDAHRQRKGQFILTGSQNLLLLQSVSESLAGRASVMHLLPLSQRELAGQPKRSLPWEKPAGRNSSGTMKVGSFWKQLLTGFYPELAAEPKRDPFAWQQSYIQTYLERDLRSVRQVGDLGTFQSFLRGLAARSGQLLNLSDLGRDLGILVNTAKSWLSVLEATFQIVVLRPYFANVGKRLRKTPKVYFTDTGTLCHLVGLSDAEHAASGPMAGVIMETAVLSEIAKTYWHRGVEPRLYFWRTSNGHEVDILVDTGQTLVPVEVKTSATPNPRMASGIVRLRELLGNRVGPGYVVHPGETRLPLGSNVTALPFAEL